MKKQIYNLKQTLKNKINKNEIAKRIISAIAFGAGGAVISKAILMLLNIVIARILSDENYGAYSLINNTVQTFSFFAGAGIGATITRDIVIYKKVNKDLTGILIKTLSMFNTILSLAVSIFVLIFSNKLSEILSNDLYIGNLLRVTSATILFMSIGLLYQNILQGFEAFKKIAQIQITVNVIGLIVTIVLTYYFKIIGAIIGLMITQMLNYILMYNSSKSYIKDWKIKLKFQLNNYVKKSILKFAIPAFLSGIFVLPVVWFTNFKFIRISGYDQFAYFSVCLQWLNIINYIPQQLGQVKPIYTELYQNKEYNEFKKAIKKLLLISIAFTMIFIVILIAVRGIILNFYGGNYEAYKKEFTLMILTSIFMSIQTQLSSVYYAMGEMWKCLLLNAIWAIVFILIFNITSQIGVLGYVLTYLLSYMAYAVISIVAFKLKIDKEIKKEGMIKSECN